MKPWYKSKTILFNLAAVVIAFVASAAPQLQSLMSPAIYTIFSFGVGVVNVMLRFITTQPLEGKE